MKTKAIPFYKEKGVTELNIAVGNLEKTKTVIYKECNDSYSIKGLFNESLALAKKAEAYRESARFIENMDSNYNLIIIRAKNKEEVDAARLGGFNYDMEATLEASSEADLMILNIRNKEYELPNQKRLAL